VRLGERAATNIDTFLVVDVACGPVRVVCDCLPAQEAQWCMGGRRACWVVRANLQSTHCVRVLPSQEAIDHGDTPSIE